MSSSGTGRSKSSNGTRPTPPLNNISSINNNTQAPPNYRTSSNTRPNIRGSSVAVPEKRKIVGQYMLGKTIGEGTFGKVKLAIHIPTGEKVAVKILEKSRIKEQADVRRVNREIKILKKSRHGNIIQLYEVLDTQNTIYLIMECADGGEMFDFIVAQKHVPEIQACKFFHQIIDGVEVLHNNDITHRDLKPENLLLKASTDGWLVKIVDFGLSNTHEGNKLLSTACGSPCYAAPEMIAGKKYNGPLADLWSIGVILFALVCGFLPFEDSNTSVLYKKIMSGDYKPPKWISAEVRDLIRCILEVDPRKRYTIADIRHHPWYNLVPEAAIPREVVDLTESEQTKAEIMKAISLAGLDTQAVLDGVASHACNSLTAMFYLLEQKHKIMKLKQQQQLAKQMKAEVASSGDPSESGAVDSVRSAQQTTAANNISTINASNGEPGQTNGTSNKMPPMPRPILPSTVIPPADVTPYRQTPVILQQHFNNGTNSSNNNTNGSVSSGGNPTLNPVVPSNSSAASKPLNAPMPSLDSYLKTGVGFPNLTNLIGGGNGAQANPGNSRDRIRTGITKRNEVPKLLIPVSGAGAGAGAGGDDPSHAPGPNVFTSQTARVGPIAPSLRETPGYLSARAGTDSSSGNGNSGVTKELLELMSGAGLGPGYEGVDRPNTRRSHVRSRGGDDVIGEAASGSAAISSGGLGQTESASSSIPVPAPPPPGVKTGSGLGGPALNPGAGVAFAARAPDQSSASSSSSSHGYAAGGRKGRNITDLSTNISVRPPANLGNSSNANGNSSSSSNNTNNNNISTIPTPVGGDLSVLAVFGPAPPQSGSGLGPESSNNPRFLALKNKLAAQGSLGPIGAAGSKASVA